MTTADMTANLAQLAARVADLEASACRCPSCCNVQRERERVKVLESYAAITAIEDSAERAILIDQLGGRRRQFFDYLGADVVRILGSAPDAATRERWSESVSAIYRDVLDLEQVEIPHMVRLRPASASFGWTRARLDITRDTARRLRTVGLGNQVEGTAYRPHDWIAMPGYDIVLTADQVAVVRDVDRALAERIDSGQIIAIDYTPEQDRAALIEEWRRIPREARRALPPRC